MRGRHAKHADDAGLAVDLDVRGLGDQLGGQERLVAQPSDAAARVDPVGASGTSPEPLPWIGADLADEIGDGDRAIRRALDASAALGELEVAAIGLELLGGGVEQLPREPLASRPGPPGRC